MASLSLDGNFDRVIAYFDLDCFYAQAEILQRPHLQDRPVGVTQKLLVVTCNYVARDLGVPKMVSIQEAKRRCPGLVLINGEDLTPYRAASKKVMRVLGRFGILERRGLDEAALDITMEVFKRSLLKPHLTEFSGHVLGWEGNQGHDLGSSISSDFQGVSSSRSDYLLMIGSHLVAEVRAVLENETGFKCSSGIASNRMLAKLVSSINKPNKQTCILGSAVSSFLQPLPVGKLPGVGHQTEFVLKELGVTKIADLQTFSLQKLSTKFGARIGLLLYDSCRGVDNSLVQNKGPPKSLSVEDSFQPCTSFKQLELIIRGLAPDLIARLEEDKEETGRRPKIFTVKWRYPGNWAFKSTSAPMPMELLSTSVPLEKRLETVVEVAMKSLLHSLAGHSFSIVVLNIGATNFTDSSSGTIGASHDIRSFLHSPCQSSKEKKKVLSKREARMNREASEKERDSFPGTKVRQLFHDNLERNGKPQGLQFHNLQKNNHSALQIGMGSCSSESDCEEEDLELLSFMERPQIGMLKGLLGQLSTPSVSKGATSMQLLDCENFHSSTCSHNLTSPSKQNSARNVYSPNKIYLVDSLNSPLDKVCCIVDRATRGSFMSSSRDSFVLDHLNETSGQNMARKLDKSSDLDSVPGKILTDVITDSFGIITDEAGMPSHNHFFCKKCGQNLGGDAQFRQEHFDYHMALELDSREQSLAKSIDKPFSSSATVSRSKSKVEKASLRHQSSLKKSRTQNSTLDCFLFRSEG